MGPSKISEAIIEVLKRQEKPIDLKELAFKIRTSPSAIGDVLNRLQKAKIVIETDRQYQLNKQENFDLSDMYL